MSDEPRDRLFSNPENLQEVQQALTEALAREQTLLEFMSLTFRYGFLGHLTGIYGAGSLLNESLSFQTMCAPFWRQSVTTVML